MGRRAAAVDHGRSSADDASLRGSVDDSEDLSAFVAQLVSDDPIPDARTPQVVPAPVEEMVDSAEPVEFAPSEAPVVASDPVVFDPPGLAESSVDDLEPTLPTLFVPLTPTGPAPLPPTEPAPVTAVQTAPPSKKTEPAALDFSEPPRSRREARERLRAAQATASSEASVPAPQPVTTPAGAPAYPSRRALRAARAVQAATEPTDERVGHTTAAQEQPAQEFAAVQQTPATPEHPVAHTASAAQGIAFGGGDFRSHHKAGAHEPGGHAHRRLQASRKPALIAGSAVLALIPGLMFAAPANAAESISPQQLQATIASNSKLIAQKLQVSAAVSDGSLQKENYVAGAIAGIVAAESGPNGPEVAVALAQALQYGGEREKIVETALTYLGDPYALGGASHDGIDCSGLTMVAYATVGVSLVHYVPSQDAVAAPISEADAQPGDLVFFNDDEHVALYLGGGMIIEAPDYGIPVRIVSLNTWSGIGYHFGRILNS